MKDLNENYYNKAAHFMKHSGVKNEQLFPV